MCHPRKQLYNVVAMTEAGARVEAMKFSFFLTPLPKAKVSLPTLVPSTQRGRGLKGTVTYSSERSLRSVTLFTWHYWQNCGQLITVSCLLSYSWEVLEQKLSFEAFFSRAKRIATCLLTPVRGSQMGKRVGRWHSCKESVSHSKTSP